MDDAHCHMNACIDVHVYHGCLPSQFRTQQCTFSHFSLAKIWWEIAIIHYCLSCSCLPPGPAEVLVGRYLKTPGVDREALQVLSKYCVFYGSEMATLTPASVRRAVDTSRQRLGVKTIDVMQFYWGDYSYDRYVDGALALSDLVGEGWMRGVGITNFDVPRCEAMAKAGVKLVSNQVGGLVGE
jgi:hypothetical protein